MTALRSIVHPTDFSDLSATAFAHALRIALAARCKLYLLHVSQYDAAEALAFPHAQRLLAQWGLSEENDAPWAVAGSSGSRSKTFASNCRSRRGPSSTF